MSGSRRRARVTVESPLDALEVTLLDSRFGVAAHGFGGLDARVEPGLYELQLRAGPTEETKLLKLEAGDVHNERNVFLDIPSPAPLDGTTTTREPHQHAARDAVARLGPHDGIVVMVRNLRGEDFPLDRKTLNRLQVVGKTLEPAPGKWEADRRQGFATWAARTGPGGVALRLAARSSDGVPTYEYRPVWVAPGWHVLVFVPNTRAGPAPEQATIHLARRGLPWEPWNESAGIGRALDLALFGLRKGRPVVPRDLLRLLLRTKFRNPMLGVVGAHALLAQPKPDFRLFDTVLGNLRNLLRPDHPDVAGLAWLGEERRHRPRARKPIPLAPVRWPPTFLTAYEALLRLDALRPGTLARGSAAERAAAQLDLSGVWTSWAEARRRAGSEQAAREAAHERVEEYVRGVATLHRIDETEALGRVNERQTALTVGLPLGVTVRALGELHSSAAQRR